MNADLLADLSMATKRVWVCSSLSADGSEPVGVICRIIQKQLRRGIRYRLLLPSATLAEPGLSARLDELLLYGADIRTTMELPVDAVLIDDEVVVLADPDGDAVALRLPSMVRVTAELTARMWASAAPVGFSEHLDDAELSVRERKLLILLANGSTDSVAATELNVSVRTVRRVIADIMDRLGARSRFEAGVKATDQGWLPDHAR